MKKRVSLFVGAVFLVVAFPSFAFVQCPGSSNFVDMGDTIQQVIQKCGPPKKMVEVTVQAAIWTYTLMSFGRDRVGFSLYFKGNSVAKMRTSQGVLKTAIQCPRGRIHIGSTPKQVVTACGQPTHIRNVSQLAQKRQGRITHLIYQTRSYLPPTTFIFKNGLLVESR